MKRFKYLIAIILFSCSLVVNAEVLTYESLFEKALLYGELLRKQGSSPVILYGHKGIDMFIAIFSCIYATPYKDMLGFQLYKRTWKSL